MSKNTQENREKIKEKLDYLGLNLERPAKVLKEFESFSFKPSKSYDDTSYKVYKYIPVNDIQILLTPTNRLTDLNQKYKMAMPIGEYLDSKSQENIEQFATLLKLINDMNIKEVEDIEKEQEKLKEVIPYKIKYADNYIWQIYYSDISNKYFMLVPTNETNNSAFFYLLKKQIECSKSRKKEYIFVPVTHQEYSGKYLVQSQITDLENYLWYFTKQWPNIYEVYDLKGNMTLKIVGETKVYKDVKSDFVITINSKEQALEWYKLIKALFILATGLPDNYTFKTVITQEGSIEFVDKENLKIAYVDLPFFIKNEVEKKKILVELENRKIEEKQESLKELKQVTEKQAEEFLSKERQIATFLECKKSFFGKIKYYFGNRKKHIVSIESYKAKKENKKEQDVVLKNPEIEEVNKNYTIEDLIEVCTKLDGRTKMVKNLQMDIRAQELKKVNLERKIKNANIYLNEIELHKRSIFEFWKFTAKDELPSLNEGEEGENTEKETLEKSFNYEEDIEDLGKQVDELQRRKLSKNETDGIFAVKEALLSCKILSQKKSKDLNKKDMEFLEKELDKLKEEYEKNKDVLQVKDFDIFGGISDDKTKLKELNNQKHREIQKDKYKVLNIMPDTELEVYIDNLRNYLKLVQEAFCKISTPLEIPVYIASTSKLEKNNLELANLDATDELYNKVKKINEDEELYFYAINLKKETPILYYSNITEYDNLNRTLPVGMDVTKKVLINTKECDMQNAKEEEIYVNYQIDEFNNKVIKLHAIEIR